MTTYKIEIEDNKHKVSQVIFIDLNKLLEICPEADKKLFEKALKPLTKKRNKLNEVCKRLEDYFEDNEPCFQYLLRDTAIVARYILFKLYYDIIEDDKIYKEIPSRFKDDFLLKNKEYSGVKRITEKIIESFIENYIRTIQESDEIHNLILLKVYEDMNSYKSTIKYHNL